MSSISKDETEGLAKLQEQQDEKTPVPSPNLTEETSSIKLQEDPPTKQETRRRAADFFRKSPVARSQSLDSTAIRPSLLQRAQMFLQEQLNVLTSSHTSTVIDSISDSKETSSNTTPTTQTKNQQENSSKLTNVTRMDNVTSPVSSISSDKISLSSQLSDPSKSSLKQTFSLPPQNARHVSQPKPIQQTQKSSTVSPYRQMPEIQSGPNPHQYLSISPLNQTKGECKV